MFFTHTRSPWFHRFAAATMLVSAPSILSAEDLPQIVDRASRAHDDLGSLVLQATLSVTTEAGKSRDNTIEIRLQRDGQQLRSWIGVLEPVALKGMQFVRNRISSREDQLLLYVPATKQVQQVPAAAREKKFLNSDFSLADFQIRPSDLTEHEIVEETSEHWVVAARPAKPSMYDWILFTIDKKDCSVLRVSFYLPGHKMVKDLVVRAFSEVNGTRLPTRIEMTSMASGSRTTLHITDFKTNVSKADLPDHTFTAEYMRGEK